MTAVERRNEVIWNERDGEKELENAAYNLFSAHKVARQDHDGTWKS